MIWISLITLKMAYMYISTLKKIQLILFCNRQFGGKMLNSLSNLLARYFLASNKWLWNYFVTPNSVIFCKEEKVCLYHNGCKKCLAPNLNKKEKKNNLLMAPSF